MAFAVPALVLMSAGVSTAVAVAVPVASDMPVAVTMTAAVSMSLIVPIPVAVARMTVLAGTLLHLAAHGQVQCTNFIHELRQVKGVDAQQVSDWDFVRIFPQATFRDRHHVVDTSDCIHHFLQLFRLHGVDFVQQHLVCVGNLLRRLVHRALRSLASQLFHEVHGVDDSDDSVDFADALNIVVPVEGLANWARIRHSRRLNENSVKAVASLHIGLFTLGGFDYALNRVDEVTPHSAAQTPVVE
mmetsp:Transcript_123260/g.354170  ORF Transcript_123260/g.354170 Transcript_123260/m.354170 type:complete len:243 (+) Transcript_123260:1-729(+)